jgi:hypothetical protein
MYLSKRYKKYSTGGNALAMSGAAATQAAMGTIPGGSMISGVTQGLAGVTDSFNTPDQYGRTKLIPGLMSGNFRGGTLGMLGAAVNWSQARRQGDTLEANTLIANRVREQNRSAAVLANSPELVYGNQGAEYYANGGALSKNYLSSMYAVGGTMEPMSSESVQVLGRSHEQGGVQLPGQNAELEGNETMHNDFVYSDRLGFAQEHKKVAKAIGKIEDKVATPDRVNALQRLEERQENLKLSQEYFKQMMGIS